MFCIAFGSQIETVHRQPSCLCCSRLDGLDSRVTSSLGLMQEEGVAKPQYRALKDFERLLANQSSSYCCIWQALSVLCYSKCLASGRAGIAHPWLISRPRVGSHVCWG